MSRLETTPAGVMVVIPGAQLAVLGWKHGDEVTVTLTMSATEGSALVIQKKVQPQTAAAGTR